MFIPIHYSYKNYPNAPKATGKSRFMGIMTSLAAMILWCGCVWGYCSSLMTESMDMEETAAGLLGLIPVCLFIWGVRKLKARITKRLDDKAEKEALEWMKNPEKAKADFQHDNLRNLFITLGGLILLVLSVLLQ